MLGLSFGRRAPSGSARPLTISNLEIPASGTVDVARLLSTLTGDVTFSKVSGHAGVSIQSLTGFVSLTTALGSGATAGFVARAENQDWDAVEAFFTLYTAPDALRVPEITTTYGGRTPVVPQTFWDVVQADANDANTHPTIGPSTHYAVKDGNWSDPTVWHTGTVPGENAIVRTMTYTVIYDVFSNVRIKDVCVCNGGSLIRDVTKNTRLVVDTGYAHGTYIDLTKWPFKSETLYWASEAPLATTRLGLNTMGPVRIEGSEKANRLFSAVDIPVGATQATLEGLSSGNWHVDDFIEIIGTEATTTVPTDPFYTGPSQFYHDGVPNGNAGVRTRTVGYRTSKGEIRQITEITGNTVKWAEPLLYPHKVYTGMLKRGQLVTIKPPVTMLSHSIVHRTLGGEPGDLDIWPDADLANLQKRAHIMFMHHDDIQVRFAEARNMGRTDTNPSLVAPNRGVVRATNGGTVITDPNNVRGRYSWHFHWTGAYFARRPVILEGCSAWAPPGMPPLPGWAITHHASRAHIERCVVSRVRGGGIVTELGNEIGQWTDNTVSECIGDGYFSENFYERNEVWENHNGHQGVAYENQARQILQQGNIAAGARYGWVYHQQDTNWRFRVPDQFSLRLWDPITQGGYLYNQGETSPDWDSYGIESTQIPDFNDNLAYGCGRAFSVSHRNHDRNDATPMLSHRFHAVNCSNVIGIMMYSFNYSFYDALWIGTGGGVAVHLGQVSWAFNFGNIHFENWGSDFSNGGNDINYNGGFYDLTFTNVGSVAPAINVPINYAGEDWTAHPYKDVMGPWELVSDTTPNPGYTVMARRWASIGEEDLPVTWPLAPLGLSGIEPAPGTPKPYYHSTSADRSVSAGNLYSQFSISGVIVDKVGVRRYPDWQNPETNLLNLGVKGPRTGLYASGERLVNRSGCFNDGGVWKTRLWFTDHERWDGSYFQFHEDITLNGFASGYLLANEVDPNANRPVVPLRPEATRRGPVESTARVVNIINGNFTYEEFSGPLAVKLQADAAPVHWSITGGANAAEFEVVDNSTLRWAGNSQKPYNGSGSNTYSVTLQAKDIFNNIGTKTITATVTPIIAYDSFTDVTGTSLVAHTGEKSGAWSRHPGSTATEDMIISAAGRVYHGGTGTIYQVSSIVPPSANYWVEAEIERLSISRNLGILGRFDPVAATGYFCGMGLRAGDGAELVQLFKLVNGAWTYLEEYVSPHSVGVVKRLRMQMQNTTISMFVNGVFVKSKVDTNQPINSAGRIGIRAAAQITDVTGDQLTSIRAGLIVP